MTARVPSSVLLGLTGLRIDGGIACVSRCMVRALDEVMGEGRLDRADRVLLLDDPGDAPVPPARGEQRLARGSHSKFVWDVWRLYRRFRHDLVLFDLVGLARSIVLPLPAFPPRRVCVFVHGIELEAAATGTRARAMRGADVILANSEFTATALRERIPETHGRIRVVPLCIDPDRISTWEAGPRPAGDPPREPAAIIVGRMSSMERGKGHDALVEAWPSVCRAVPGAQLWIVGSGDDATRIEARARALDPDGAVRMFGRVPDEALGDLFRRASVFAMPSRQEGFGLVYAEAMWHGLPCIGSTADAAGNVIRDGKSGLLVPYGDVRAIADAVIRLLGNVAEARAMGEAARRDARERFGYPRFKSDLLAALEIG